MKLAIAVTFLVGAVLSAQSTNPVDEARKLFEQKKRAEAEQVLRSAVAQNPNDIESLQALIMFLTRRVEDTPEIAVAAQRYAEVLLQQRERKANAKPTDVALALEANAYFLRKLGRTPEAEPLSARAAEIRKTEVRTSQPDFLGEASVKCQKVGGSVTPPRLVSKQEPEYSEEALWAMHQGAVTLFIAVDVDGWPKALRLVRGLGYGLDEKAAAAVQTWRFEPGQQNGASVPVCAQIEVNFRLL
jgi:TonB family protein